jgi:polysaccharide pyruvyl transferase WcaK-like protein
MAAFVSWLLGQGYQVRLLIGEVRSDTPAVEALTSILRSTCDPKLLSSLIASPISNVQELLNEIERTDLVVASRFHNLVHALALGRPTISVGYSQKFEPLMAGMHLAKYCHRIDSLDVEKLITSFNLMVSDYPRLCATISEIGDQYRSTLESVFDRAFSPRFPNACNAA